MLARIELTAGLKCVKKRTLRVSKPIRQILRETMKIQSSQVHMQARHQQTQVRYQQQHLEIWSSKADRGRNHTQHEEIKMQAIKTHSHLDSVIEEDQLQLNINKLTHFKFSLLQAIIEKLTGKSIEVYDAEELSANIEKIESQNSNIAHLASKRSSTPQASAGYGLIYRSESSQYQSEKVEFNVQAKVITDDGIEIDIEVDVRLSYELLQTEEIEIREGDAKIIDPLVINFNGNGVELSQRQFSFDLDFDGEQDNIAFTRDGSGFLALDSNENGYIDDGRELFGPQSGSGFDELAEYDDDNNMFIDEADEVYGKLKIWTKDEQGNDFLLSLGESGVDAIYLGFVDTSLQLVNERETVVGQLSGSSFYIDEYGEAGLIQEVDLHA